MPERDLIEEPDELFDQDLECFLFNQKPEWVEQMEDSLDWFKQEIQQGSRGFDTGFAGLNKALNKLQSGFHVIAAESNLGKTGFLSQMAFNVAKLNSDAYVLDISLDDPLKEKLARVVASHNRVLINAVKDPLLYAQQFPGMLKRVHQAVDDLKKYSWHYRAIDSNTLGTDIEDIAEYARDLQIKLQALSTPLRLVLFIDNFHDLTTNVSQLMYNDKMRYDYIAQAVADLAIELDIPIVCTAELRKVNGEKRPSKDSIRESIKIYYEAKSVLMCYNEVGIKGESASIYYMRSGDPLKQPVFEVKVSKNKYSSFKGRLFYEFYPDMSYFEEANNKNALQYAQAVYNSEN